ncbi:thioesterase II family protein [Streptacidiphilus cavernicola]|uniref:Thioesterase II family protein n=1 Tax=Streptacidiphilus cavernicola TaxID=3342716 RepID=A0ABV6VRH7_9ACTN
MNKWFRSYRTDRPAPGRPAVRLLCLPHGGGGPSAFRTWARHAPDRVEILAACYPGRQDRIADPFAASLEQLADDLAEALAPLGDVPLALFGHSMGAALARETALRLTHRHGIVPAHVFVSGARAPQLLRRPRQLDDTSILAKIRELGSSSLDVLDDPDLLELALPAIRADFQLMARYIPYDAEPLDCPITAYSATRDPDCEVEAARAWSGWTRAGFALRVFPGDHFYLEPLERELVTDICRRLGE